MGLLGGRVGDKLLHRLVRVSPGNDYSTAYEGVSKVEALLGPGIWSELAGKTVLDFGCEAGIEAVDIAQHTDAKVIGLDINEHALSGARRRAEEAGVSDRCRFVNHLDEPVDVIVSFDAFEHFEDAAAELRTMRKLLKDGGRIVTCFGPTWFHPYGGHVFSFFPYAHLVFSEQVLLSWYREKTGRSATRFGEINGGLNQMTVARFIRIVSQSPFRFESFEAVPIRKLRPVANRLTREFTTSVVRCRLVPR